MTLDVIGRIGECFLLSYAVDPQRAASLVPAGLQPVTCRGSAFLNVVVCHVEGMRPRLTPSALGVTYWHIAYRLHVQATLMGGARTEGLYFLRSDVDAPLVGAIGNRLTDLKFHGSKVRFWSESGRWSLRVDDPDEAGSATLSARRAASRDRASDPLFSSLEERERFLKYAPFGLSVSPSGRQLRIVEVRRDETVWKEEPVEVESAAWSYPRVVGLSQQRLVRATRVSPIDYTWRIGRTEELPAAATPPGS